MFDVRSDLALPEGELDLIVRYTRAGEHEGEALLAAAVVGAEPTALGAGPVQTSPYRQTMYGMDIGRDAGSTVSADHVGPLPFEGTLHWVEYELQDDRHDLVRAAEQQLENQLADQ